MSEQEKDPSIQPDSEENSNGKRKTMGIRPADFRKEKLHEHAFEDALNDGREILKGISSDERIETSFKPHIDGLVAKYEIWSNKYTTVSPSTAMACIGWWWLSFLTTDPLISRTVKEYWDLKDEINATRYSDLDELMKRSPRPMHGLGWCNHKPVNVRLPAAIHSALNEISPALGMPLTLLYQIGLAKAISHNRKGLFKEWRDSDAEPLFEEFMLLVGERSKYFSGIRATLENRLAIDKLEQDNPNDQDKPVRRFFQAPEEPD